MSGFSAFFRFMFLAAQKNLVAQAARRSALRDCIEMDASFRLNSGGHYSMVALPSVKARRRGVVTPINEPSVEISAGWHARMSDLYWLTILGAYGAPDRWAEVIFENVRVPPLGRICVPVAAERGSGEAQH